MSTSLRYFNLWSTLAKISLIADMEYRVNFIAKILADIVWYAAQLSLFEVLFKHTTLISGWDIIDLRVFMGVLFIVDAAYMVMVHENLEGFSTKIVKGELDLILAKPINSQFMMSFGRVNSPYFVNIALIAIYLFWACSKLLIPPTAYAVLGCFFAGACGFIVMFSIRFIFASSAVLFTKADALNQIWYQLYRLATRPDAVYPSWLRILIFTVLPIGYITSVPARVLLGKDFTGILGISIAVALATLYISTRWWKFVLSRYSSASS